MKIYILPLSDIVKPNHGFIAPAHNQDFGVENDVLVWLASHPEYIANSPDEADFDLCQPLWNRYYTQHWGSDESVKVLQEEILRTVSRNRPTFTVCEYDIMSLQPQIDLCNITVFTASRNGDKGIDIPLLCSPHSPRFDKYYDDRRWLASFMGKFETSDYRGRMQEVLAHSPGVFMSESKDERQYCELLADTEIALAPRGHGGQSFRFYEAMQFCCVPFLIGDLDTRPFKKWLDWNSFSLYTDDVTQIDKMLTTRWVLGGVRQMGYLARQVWFNELGYGKWCKYLIKNLEALC